MNSSLMPNLRTTIRSVPPRVWLPRGSVWVGCYASLSQIFERAGVAGHQSLARDHRAFCDLATDRPQRAYDILREHHALTVARVNRGNSALADALRPVPKIDVGGWVWVYNTAATIRQDAKPDTDAKVLEDKLSLNWTGLYKVLAIGP